MKKSRLLEYLETHQQQRGPSSPEIGWPGYQEKGQNLVEFALVLPLLLLLILGLINIGLIVNSQIILTHAAWEGARVGATLDVSQGEGDAEITAAIQASVKGLVNPIDVSVEISPAEDERAAQAWPAPRGQLLNVHLAYVFTASLPLEIELNLEASATSRMEFSNPP